jgi:hypothetical protein
MERCLVIVSRERPELVRELAAIIYGPQGEVEIQLDRRYRQLRTWGGGGVDRRSPFTGAAHLHDHGFVVIPRA